MLQMYTVLRLRADKKHRHFAQDAAAFSSWLGLMAALHGMLELVLLNLAVTSHYPIIYYPIFPDSARLTPLPRPLALCLDLDRWLGLPVNSGAINLERRSDNPKILTQSFTPCKQNTLFG